MIEIRNYTLLQNFEAGKKYEIVKNESGEEIGFRLKGLVTTFDVQNENGQVFKNYSYNKFVAEYFVEHSLNVPIDIMHIRDLSHIAGYAEKLEALENGIEVTAFVPKGVYYYNLIKVLIDNGILQGFSNYGYARDYEWSDDYETMIIKDFALISISLVDAPADKNATYLQNTIFKGFGGNPAKLATPNFVTQKNGEAAEDKKNLMNIFY